MVEEKITEKGHCICLMMANDAESCPQNMKRKRYDELHYGS